MRPVFVLALVTLLLAAHALAASPAAACRCTDPGPTRAQVARHDVVVSGVVRSVVVEGRVGRQVILDVDRVVKGEVPTTEAGERLVAVLTAQTSCAITDIAPGETWLVFARRTADGQLSAMRCNGSRRLARAGEPLGDAARRILDRLSARR